MASSNWMYFNMGQAETQRLIGVVTRISNKSGIMALMAGDKQQESGGLHVSFIYNA